MKKFLLTSMVLPLLMITNCTPAETARFVFLSEFQQNILANDEVHYNAKLFLDPRDNGESESHARLFAVKNGKTIMEVPMKGAGLDALNRVLLARKLMGNRASVDTSATEKEHFNSAQGEQYNSAKISYDYAPVVINFTDEKKQKFISITLWEKTTTIKMARTEPIGQNPPVVTQEFSVGDVTVYLDNLEGVAK